MEKRCCFNKRVSFQTQPTSIKRTCLVCPPRSCFLSEPQCIMSRLLQLPLQTSAIPIAYSHACAGASCWNFMHVTNQSSKPNLGLAIAYPHQRTDERAPPISKELLDVFLYLRGSLPIPAGSAPPDLAPLTSRLLLCDLANQFRT